MKFQAGDVVKVLSKGLTGDVNGMGPGKRWQNEWVDTMDSNVGLSFTISDIDPTLGAFFVEADSDNLHGGFGYPLNILGPVELLPTLH